MTANNSALYRWTVAGSEMAPLLTEFEDHFAIANNGHHRKQKPAVQLAFANDIHKPVNALPDMGNPFEDQHDLIVLHTRRVVADEINAMSS